MSDCATCARVKIRTRPRWLPRWAWHVFNGYRFGIPACCVAAFAWTCFRGGWPPTRGIRYHDAAVRDRHRFYIPCGWLHDAHEDAA